MFRSSGSFDESTKAGTTVIELLVVVAVLATLLAFFLSAIQSAREAARRAQCQNNLKEVALGVLLYHDSNKEFPCGGWGHFWVGVPERGGGRKQPGGWIYSILPQVEYANIRDLGIGLTGPAATEAYSQRLQTPLSLFTCPSRRPAAAWPVSDTYPWIFTPKPFGNVGLVARADYAINAGTSHFFSFSGPPDFAKGDDEVYWRDVPNPRSFSGISHLRLSCSMKAIQDGTSTTYLVGEKYLDTESYFTGKSGGDNESMYAGYCSDLHRFAGVIENLKILRSPYATPLSDSATPDNGIAGVARFGSAHPEGFLIAYCDGSVHFVEFNVDPEIHFRCGHRSDQGRPLSLLD